MTAVPYLRIATEEAYAPPELFSRYRKLLEDGSHNDPGFASLMGFYLTNDGPRIVQVREKMQDLGDLRIRDMDATGVAKQILSITSPGSRKRSHGFFAARTPARRCCPPRAAITVAPAASAIAKVASVDPLSLTITSLTRPSIAASKSD